MPETWTEIRCPACVQLGWHDARLLFEVCGDMPKAEFHIRIRCRRCKSVVKWQSNGTLEIVTCGQQNHKRQIVAFE